MGIYAYILRTKTKTLSCGSELGTYTYTARASSLSRWSPDPLSVARVERATNLWRGRKPPEYVIMGDSEELFPEQAAVFRNSVKGHPVGPVWYDCDPLGEMVGWLHRSRVGRRVVWSVVPLLWEVCKFRVSDGGSIGPTRIIESRRMTFDRDEARATKEEYLAEGGEDTCVEVVRCSVQEGREVRERVFLHEPEDVAFVRKLREAAKRAGISTDEVRRVVNAPRAFRLQKEQEESVDPELLQRAAAFQASVAELGL